MKSVFPQVSCYSSFYLYNTLFISLVFPYRIDVSAATADWVASVSPHFTGTMMRKTRPMPRETIKKFEQKMCEDSSSTEDDSVPRVEEDQVLRVVPPPPATKAFLIEFKRRIEAHAAEQMALDGEVTCEEDVRDLPSPC